MPKLSSHNQYRWLMVILSLLLVMVISPVFAGFAQDDADSNDLVPETADDPSVRDEAESADTPDEVTGQEQANEPTAEDTPPPATEATPDPETPAEVEPAAPAAVTEAPTQPTDAPAATTEPPAEEPTDAPAEAPTTAEPPTGEETPPAAEAPTETVTDDSGMEPLETPVTVETEAPTEAPAEPASPIDAGLPAEPVLFPLFSDNFDAPELMTWIVGSAWSRVPNGDGQALQVSGSTEPVIFSHDGIFDVAVQLAVKLNGGTASMSVRHSNVGFYAVVLSADGTVRLFRNDQLLKSTTVAAPGDGWHTLRLSAMGDVVRVAVDGAEVIATRDEAPLPPGTIMIAGSANSNPLIVDDFQLWIPELDNTAAAPTPEPTPEIEDAVVFEAMDDDAFDDLENADGMQPAAPAAVTRATAEDEGPLEIRDFNGRIRVKVLVITHFELGEITGDFPGETQKWVENEGLDLRIDVPGALNPVYCNQDGLCVTTTGVGFSNAASSIMALGFSRNLNLRDAYIIVAGIAGVDPEDGTLGSAAWADYVIDGDLAHEIDAREMPAEFDYPYFQLGCTIDPNQPFCPEARVEGVEVFQLNTELVDVAYALTQNLTLIDNADSQATRALYPQAAASSPPTVLRCDSLAAGTYWHGDILGDWANWWAANWTNGAANYCMTNQEDSATMTALSRLDDAGKLDFDRVLVLRTASNFDQQFPGIDAFGSLGRRSGGFFPSLDNAYLVGSTVSTEIITNWRDWRNGPPEPPAPGSSYMQFNNGDINVNANERPQLVAQFGNNGSSDLQTVTMTCTVVSGTASFTETIYTNGAFDNVVYTPTELTFGTIRSLPPGQNYNVGMVIVPGDSGTSSEVECVLSAVNAPDSVATQSISVR